ncbi:MAG: hypothetical protein AAGN46_01320 [Acidobacteriota bacterium]
MSGGYATIERDYHDSWDPADWKGQVVHQALIILAGPDGIVRKSARGISRAAKLPRDLVDCGLEILQRPDPESRCQEEDGRRAVRVEAGWLLVGTQQHRGRIQAQNRRSQDASRKRRQRAEARDPTAEGAEEEARPSAPVHTRPQASTPVRRRPHVSAPVRTCPQASARVRTRPTHEHEHDLDPEHDPDPESGEEAGRLLAFARSRDPAGRPADPDDDEREASGWGYRALIERAAARAWSARGQPARGLSPREVERVAVWEAAGLPPPAVADGVVAAIQRGADSLMAPSVDELVQSTARLAVPEPCPDAAERLREIADIVDHVASREAVEALVPLELDGSLVVCWAPSEAARSRVVRALEAADMEGEVWISTDAESEARSG